MFVVGDRLFKDITEAQKYQRDLYIHHHCVELELIPVVMGRPPGEEQLVIGVKGVWNGTVMSMEQTAQMWPNEFGIDNYGYFRLPGIGDFDHALKWLQKPVDERLGYKYGEGRL